MSLRVEGFQTVHPGVCAAQRSGEPGPDHFVDGRFVCDALRQVDSIVLEGEAGHEADDGFLWGMVLHGHGGLSGGLSGWVAGLGFRGPLCFSVALRDPALIIRVTPFPNRRGVLRARCRRPVQGLAFGFGNFAAFFGFPLRSGRGLRRWHLGHLCLRSRY